MIKNKKLFGTVILLIGTAIWGFAFAFQREAMDVIGPFTFGGARMSLAAIVTWCVSLGADAAAKKRGGPEKPAEYKRNTVTGGLLCGLALMAATTSQQIGLIYTPAGKAGFLTALYIVLVPLISMVFLGKRYGWTTFAGIILGAAGLYFLSISGGLTITAGDALVILCALCFAVQILLIDRFVAKADALKMAAWEFTVCTVVSWVLAFIKETPSAEQLSAALVGILYCGVLSGGMGYTIQMIAQKYVDPAAASLLMSFEAVFAVLGGVLMLGESLSLREIIGCILMFAAVIIVQMPSSFGRKKGPENER